MRPSRLSLLLLFAAVSCSDPYLDDVLDRAETMMEEHPDTSLAMLRRLDPAGIDTPHRKARFALDYAMALEKNWVDTTNVEIIMPALKHYRWPCRKKERFLSRYYYARILENGQSLENAIQAFSEAEHSFRKGLDSVYLIRIQAAKGRIYAKQFINDKAEIALQEAARYASKLRDPENEQRMMLSLADFYGATGRLRQKDSILVMMGDPLPGLELEKAQSVASLVFKDPARLHSLLGRLESVLSNGGTAAGIAGQELLGQLLVVPPETNGCAFRLVPGGSGKTAHFKGNRPLGTADESL